LDGDYCSSQQTPPAAAPFSENAQQIAHEKDHHHCAETDAAAPAVAPAAVSEISSAEPENQQQNDNEYEHGRTSFIATAVRGYVAALIWPGVLDSTTLGLVSSEYIFTVQVLSAGDGEGLV